MSREVDDPTRGALIERVEQRFETAQVPFVAKLVDAPSGTREPQDVELAARILDEEARALGLSVELHPAPSGDYAAHRVYRTPACEAQTRALALVGHVDTVFPRSLGFFGFRREGDTAFGPGVLDMKSGLSAMFFALRALREVDAPSFAALPLRIVVVSDEEVGSPSSKPLFDTLAPHISAALVFEAGRVEDRIVTRRKGGASYRLRVRGRAAHSGNRHAEGVSAIHALALAIPQIEALTDYARGITLNVGLVSGGTAKNTVPEEAEAVIDMRYERVADVEGIEAALSAIAAAPLGPADRWPAGGEPPPRLANASATLSGGVTRPPMEASPASIALMQRYGVHAAACGLGHAEAPLQGGGSDASLLAAAGVPSIDGLGPSGAHFHETLERCSLSSLCARTQALAAFLLEEARAHAP